MKVWEEAWYVDADGAIAFRDSISDKHALFLQQHGEVFDPARGRLAAAAPEMARLLIQHQYGRTSCCLGCSALASEECMPDCPWMTVLQKAGVR